MLTVAEMKAAIFAKSCDTDPHFDSGIEAARASVRMSCMNNRQPDKKQYQKAEEKYNLGKRILKAHTMEFTDRNTVYQLVDGTYPGQEQGKSGFLRLEAGFIAGSQAYDTAVFNPRE